MFRTLALVCCLVAVMAQPLPVDESPKPYSFSYEAQGEDGGSSSRSESADGSGTVVGSYTLTNPDGTTRNVQYTAGPEGFSASIDTNEPGTKAESPANVELRANPIDVAPAPAPIAAIRRVAPTVRYIQPAVQPITYIRPAPRPATSRYVLVPADALGGLGGLGGLGAIRGY